jgi:hypothetical protein
MKSLSRLESEKAFAGFNEPVIVPTREQRRKAIRAMAKQIRKQSKQLE